MSPIPQTPAPQSPLRVIRTVLQTTFAFALRAPLFRVGVIVVGVWLVMAGLVVSLIVVAMFVHPGGIGMEKLFGPVFAFFALVLLSLGGACVYAGIYAKAATSSSGVAPVHPDAGRASRRPSGPVHP